jgi:membrane fusion protein, multidrug efflux system
MAEQVFMEKAPVSPPPRTAPAEEKPPRTHYALIVIAAVVIIGVLIALPMLLAKKTPPRRAPAVTISTTNAVQGNIDVTVWALGTVTPVYTAMISPRVDGQVINVDYKEGQLIRSNDLLAEIDPGPYQAMEMETEGQLARDKALLEGANIDLKRYQDAYEKKAIPKQQVDDQLATMHQDQGTVKYDEGQVAAAKVQLAYCFIRAPFDGRVGLRLVDPGNVVHAANTNALVVVAQLQPITVIFSPSEDYLPQIERQLQAHHQMQVEVWDRDQKIKLAEGIFLTTDTEVDTGTGTIRIKALFDNKDMSLFPNQFVNAKLIIDTLTNVTLIPTSAIQRNPTGAFVYVVTNQTVTITNRTGTLTTNQTVVTMHDITAGIVDADTTQVEGLDPGAVIAADNFNKLGDNMKVNVRQPVGEGQKGGAPGNKKHRQNNDAAQVNPP